jgi:hypothetical protein
MEILLVAQGVLVEHQLLLALLLLMLVAAAVLLMPVLAVLVVLAAAVKVEILVKQVRLEPQIQEVVAVAVEIPHQQMAALAAAA